MYRKLSVIFLLVLFSACHGNQEGPACFNVACTKEFRSLIVHFVDKHGASLIVTNFEVVNLHTNKPVEATWGAAVDPAPGYYMVANDNNVGEFSTGGDDVKISATNPGTGQVKTVIYKIASDCCHINKLSGSAEVAFDL